MSEKTWVEKFPKPEGERPPHPGPEPKWTGEVPTRIVVDFPPEWSEYTRAKTAWEEARNKYNTYGVAMRKFLVARAVDELNNRKDKNVVEDAVYILGMEYLEGNPTTGGITSIFGSLFGGIL